MVFLSPYTKAILTQLSKEAEKQYSFLMDLGNSDGGQAEQGGKKCGGQYTRLMGLGDNDDDRGSMAFQHLYLTFSIFDHFVSLFFIERQTTKHLFLLD